jgi:hypothetical protein
MIRRLLVPTFAAIAAGALPAAATTYVTWGGDAVILTATAACNAATSERAKIGPGTVLRTYIRPAGFNDNGTTSLISFNHDGVGHVLMELADGLAISGSAAYTGHGITPNGIAHEQVKGTYSKFVFTPSATPFAATTPFAKLTGTVDRFMLIDKCTVTFRAGYGLRPD